MSKKYVCDMDGILCQNGHHEDYATAIPIQESINNINELFRLGNNIVLHTSRKFKDRKVTKAWLQRHGVKYHRIQFDKPTADAYIDDKALKFVPNLGNTKINRKKLVICYSGGMDSFMAYHYALIYYKPEEITLLNFDIGHPYQAKELEGMKQIGLPFQTIKLDLCSEERGNMPTVENYIIPARNLIFATLAAGFGETVWLIGIKYEDHHLMYDKNTNFFHTASMACSQAIGAKTEVTTPFRNYSKTDLFRLAKEWGVEEGLSHTTSCYHPVHKRCGGCGLCFKRAIAGRLNGIEETFFEEPFESKVGLEFIDKYVAARESGDYSHYSEERVDETLRVVRYWRVNNRAEKYGTITASYEVNAQELMDRYGK